MPIPTTGQVSFQDVNTNIGVAATTPRDMAWVLANTKVPVSDFNSIKGLYYFQLNGSPTVVNCSNCSNCVGAQCRDAKAYFQTNCNCNCSGNCNTNCNCNCNCRC